VKVITTTDPDGTTQVAVEEPKRWRQVLSSPKPEPKPERSAA
jgi:hypothetical protein